MHISLGFHTAPSPGHLLTACREQGLTLPLDRRGRGCGGPIQCPGPGPGSAAVSRADLRPRTWPGPPWECMPQATGARCHVRGDTGPAVAEGQTPSRHLGTHRWQGAGEDARAHAHLEMTLAMLCSQSLVL